MSLLAATPGWRLVMIDREAGEGAVALPIIAWDYDDEGNLWPIYLPYETGVLPLPLKPSEVPVGFLAPGEELDLAWHQEADRERERQDEAEARADEAGRHKPSSSAKGAH